jgi:Tfp pilus assembly protein PilW
MKRRAALATDFSRSRASRGFTLVELLVALTGGLFVSIAVFAIARDSSRFYQREGRLATATLASIVGFERLRNDLARAGFLSSPNVATDPLVCSRPDSTAPLLLRDLASVRIRDANSLNNSDAVLVNNGIAPDELILTGSYSSADEFPIRAVEADAGGSEYRVYLQTVSGPMFRLGWAASTAKKALLQNIFATGRALRIVDNEGRQHYGLISDVNVDAPTEPYISLSTDVPLVFRSATSRLCGLKGLETGATANVVNFIRYDIRNINENPNYTALYTTSAAEPHEGDRTELVRTELDANGDELQLAGSEQVVQELVAEYAVDFQLDISTITNPLSPAVTLLRGDDSDFVNYADLPSTGSTPQRVRAVRVRLSVRSREPDREVALDSANGPGLFRIGLGASAGVGPFARVRTLQADIMLNNNARAQW